ncbi:metallophosphoesterase [Gracilibacillus oryzae]|uniref:Metallophosphoesterase n=1 Tax=Gracilibacillus oryzae TaxID=1672701 RepID=A0A7C8KQ49_9BACI|nr:metallophosphoesterase [Gracilibacillus oryzae]KAB8135774.1 metallophosphoesterase [Gracilibacillus oryzae]
MRKKIIVMAIVLFAITGIGKIYYDTNIFKVETVNIETEKLANNQSFTILQISDVHNKEYDHKLIEKVFDINPDIIVITGDLISRTTDKFDNVFTLAEDLVALCENTYYVTGNHEWENPLRQQLWDGLKERDVHILDNQNTLVETPHEFDVQLAGVADPSTEHDELDLATEGLNDSYYTILLSHAPDVMETDYPDNIDLILSGHTHGGQIRIPFVGAMIAPDQGLFPEYDKGLFSITENQHLYIDSGLGTSTVPIRLFNQSQMTLLTIEGKNRR